MKPFILIALNAVVIGFFVWLSRKKNLLSTFSDGKWRLTWDEFPEYNFVIAHGKGELKTDKKP